MDFHAFFVIPSYDTLVWLHFWRFSLDSHLRDGRLRNPETIAKALVLAAHERSLDSSAKAASAETHRIGRPRWLVVLLRSVGLDWLGFWVVLVCFGLDMFGFRFALDFGFGLDRAVLLILLENIFPNRKMTCSNMFLGVKLSVCGTCGDLELSIYIVLSRGFQTFDSFDELWWGCRSGRVPAAVLQVFFWRFLMLLARYIYSWKDVSCLPWLETSLLVFETVLDQWPEPCKTSTRRFPSWNIQKNMVSNASGGRCLRN